MVGTQTKMKCPNSLSCVSGLPETGEIFESLPVVRLDIALVLVAAGVTTLVYWVNVWWNCSGDGAI